MNNGSSSAQQPAVSTEDTLRYEDEIKKLKLMLLQRDNEIALLLSLIDKNKHEGGVSLPVKREEENLLVKSVLQPSTEVIFPAQIAQKKLE